MKKRIFNFEIEVCHMRVPLNISVYKITNGYVAGNRYFETLEQALSGVKKMALNYEAGKELDDGIISPSELI